LPRKTAEQAATYGGAAGVAYDECYHQACDTTNNLNTRALDEMGDAVAHAALTLVRSRTGFFEDDSLVATSARATARTAVRRPHTRRALKRRLAHRRSGQLRGPQARR